MSPSSNDRTKEEKEQEKELETAKVITMMQMQMQVITESVERLRETNDGTLRTRGLRDRLLLAEEQIKTLTTSYENLKNQFLTSENNIRREIANVGIDVLKKLDEKLAPLIESDKQQNSFLKRAEPWVSVIAWVITAVAAGLIGLLVSGHLIIGVK
jgi:hypothetical protein